MATSYTTLLGFALPTTGELTNTWGAVVNNSITELVEDSIAATATASVTSADWTLSTTGSGVTNEARCAIIIPTGTPGVSRNVIAPGQSKAYVVINESNAAIVFKSVATTGVTILAGDKALISWDGLDFVRIGASAGGTNTQVQYNSNGNLAGSANLTYNDGTGTLSATAFSGSGASLTNLNASNAASGTLAVARGGTGQTTYTDGQLLIGNSTGNTLSKSTLTAGSGVSISNGNGSITISATGTGGTLTSVGMSVPAFLSVSPSTITTSGTFAVSYSGTALPTVNGGTGLTAYTANGVLYASTTSAISQSANLIFDGTTLTADTITGKLKAYSEAVTTATVSTSTYNLDTSLTNIFDITLGNNVTFTFTNPPASGTSRSVTVILRQDGAGNRTATFTNAKYSNGLAPTLSTGGGDIDVLTFFTVNGGSFWFGTFAMADVS